MVTLTIKSRKRTEKNVNQVWEASIRCYQHDGFSRSREGPGESPRIRTLQTSSINPRKILYSMYTSFSCEQEQRNPTRREVGEHRYRRSVAKRMSARKPKQRDYTRNLYDGRRRVGPLHLNQRFRKYWRFI